MPDPNPTTPHVALLCQRGPLGGHLREALGEFGAAVVYEAPATELDRAALERSGASVVIVNLDPDVEAHLDEVYDLLDDDRYNVVFNDAQVSSGLSGWDQARWARNLAAKILGRPEVADPPRPANAEAPRSPAQRMAAHIPDFAAHTLPETPAVPTESAPQAAASPFAGDADLGAALDALLADAEALDAPPAATPAQPAAASDLALELDALLRGDAPAESASPPTTDAFAIGLDDLVGQPATSAATPVSDLALELDSLLDVDTQPAAVTDGLALAPDIAEAQVPASTPAAAKDGGTFDFTLELDGLLDSPTPPAPAPVDSSGLDSSFAAELDALFGAAPTDAPARPRPPTGRETPALDFDIELTELDVGPAARGTPEQIPAPVTSPAGDSPFAALSDWSLAPIDEEPAAPAAPAKLSAADPGVQKVSAENFLAGSDWTLEPVADDAAVDGAKPTNFGIEKMAAHDYLAPEGGSADPAHFKSATRLELLSVEEAVAPEDVAADSPARTAQIGSGLGAIRRVIVLGASIGGPEAVREYLAAIPAGFPALFLLAQHMGAEFLDLMAAQLAKNTALTVRTPGDGELVSHGEVVVVPTASRLLIDHNGGVRLAPPLNESPYSPSIDQVLRDVADRFGANALGIVFSGMAHDAIEGSRYLAAQGGTVWAQDPATCVVSSMVDGAREAGVVGFLGSPAELAQKTIAEFGAK